MGCHQSSGLDLFLETCVAHSCGWGLEIGHCAHGGEIDLGLEGVLVGVGGGGKGTGGR